MTTWAVELRAGMLLFRRRSAVENITSPDCAIRVAADPAALLAPSSIDPADVVARWEPYQASHPDFMLARLTQLLDPPATVSLSVEDGTLVARGAAPHDWVRAARRVTQMMPSVTRYSDESLVDLDLARGESGAVMQQIERSSIPFAVGSAELTPDQGVELHRVMTEIKRYGLLARSLGVQPRVEVWGHADQSGSQALNARLIAARAEQVCRRFSHLESIGPTSICGPKASGKLREDSRTATFKVKPIAAPAVTNERAATSGFKKRFVGLALTRLARQALSRGSSGASFREKYQTTVGVKIDKKTVRIGGRELSLILWDLAGEDDFYQVRMSYLRGSAGYLLVADGTRRATLDKALELQQRAEGEIGKVPFILLINKLDAIGEWEVKDKDLAALSQSSWQVVATSAKTGGGRQ